MNDNLDLENLKHALSVLEEQQSCILTPPLHLKIEVVKDQNGVVWGGGGRVILSADAYEALRERAPELPAYADLPVVYMEGVDD